MVKEIENEFGIKVNDIFYTDKKCGFHGHYIQFFQVVALNENNQIIIKEVERKIDSKNEEELAFVVPDKDNFKTESFFIEDNNVGTTKMVQKGLESKSDDIIYITFDYKFFGDGETPNKMPTPEYAYLWDGIAKCHYNDFFKYVNEEKI